MKAFAVLAFSFEQKFHTLKKIVHWWNTLLLLFLFFLSNRREHRTPEICLQLVFTKSANDLTNGS